MLIRERDSINKKIEESSKITSKCCLKQNYHFGSSVFSFLSKGKGLNNVKDKKDFLEFKNVLLVIKISCL